MFLVRILMLIVVGGVGVDDGGNIGGESGVMVELVVMMVMSYVWRW